MRSVMGDSLGLYVVPSITTSGAAIDEVSDAYSRSLLPINFGPILCNV